MRVRVRWARAKALFVLLAACIGLLAHTPARATIQEESCIAPDIEYPVPCDEEED
jgi:hypothetical protein